ncbi:MAG TPA: glycosyltransferase family 39 protein [Acidobacteriaceae bacterium]|nr:glycosyltransferase family 39 protein [Acidobacteriaceae bacterium]
MDSERKRPQIAVIVALAAGLLLRLWFVRHAPLIAGDALVYGGIAKNWMTRGVYGFYANGSGGISPTLLRLPGYPIFLVACFRVFGMEHYGAVRYVQVAVDLVTCGFAAEVSRRVFGEKAGLATLWAAALCPFTANYAAAPLTETLVLMTIAAAFYGLLRWRDAGAGLNAWVWLVGVALAYSLLLRPDQGLLSVAVLPAMWWGGRRRWTPVIACVACIVLPLTAWTARNWHTFHVFQPLAPRYANDPGEDPPTQFGRWYRTWAIEFSSTDAVYWNYNGGRIDPEALPSRVFDAGSAEASQHLRQQTLEALQRYDLTTQQTGESEAAFGALADERIHAHPIQYYVLLPLARLADMALRPRTEMMAVPMEWWRWRGHPGKSLFAAGYAALNLAYFAIAAVGFWRWRRAHFAGRAALAWAMAASVMLRCALLLTIDNAEPRYTLEFFPVVFVCAGALFWTRAEQPGNTAHN